MGAVQGPRASDDRWIFHGLVVLLVWSPIPLGSNRPWALALLEAGLFLLALLWLAQAWRGRVSVTRAAVKARWVLALLGAWSIFGLFQLVPLPPALVELVSPASAAHWRETRAILGLAESPAYISISLDPFASRERWRLGFALVTLFVLCLLLVRSRRRLRFLVGALVLAAVIQAMLASLLALTGSGLGFIAPSARAHGTFANPNHLAGYLEMSIALGMGLLVADLAETRRGRGWRGRILGWIRTLLGAKARLRIYLAIMVVTLVLTASRMGNLALFGSLAIGGAIGVAAYRKSPRPILFLLVSLVLIDVLILGSWFGLDRVRERLEQTVLSQDARYQIGQQTRDYAEAFAYVGSGGGTFYAVFPAYRDPSLVNLHFPHADNDLLEFRLEYGWVGLILLGAVVLLSLAAALRVLWMRDDPLPRGMALASVMGVSAILIHSTADANLQIPSNAALFMLLLALPWIGLGLGGEETR